MRAINLGLARQTRPVLVITREHMVPVLTTVVLAPVTSTVRGIPSEVAVDPRNGLDHDGVVSLDNRRSVPTRSLGRLLGLLHEQ